MSPRLVILAVAIAVLAFNPLTLGVVGGIFWNRDFQNDTLLEFQERNFAEVCPIWRDASTWDRWFDSTVSNKGWCADYIERLAQKT